MNIRFFLYVVSTYNDNENKRRKIMDANVQKVQNWLNSTYGSNSTFRALTPDGMAGNSTCTALVKALQIELGLSVDGSFGTGTANAFASLSASSDSSISKVKNQILILQGGFYCKGINPNGFDGSFGSGTISAVKTLQTAAGLTGSNINGVADAKLMKALLNTDAYTLSGSGDSSIRSIQQALNGNYYSLIGLIPCDGIPSKSLTKALVKGLQYEESKFTSGISIDGVWGNQTKDNCPTLQKGATNLSIYKKFVYILQYALYLNGFDPNGFDGGFGNGALSAVKIFQSFSGLISTGIVDPTTWASLMISYGDITRVGTACDCITILTAEKAQTLVQNGRKYVGRYLTGNSQKALTRDELKIIYDAGLSIFPIYETSGNTLSYFSAAQGKIDATLANLALQELGFTDETLVYFCVDADINEDDCQANVLPYFKSIYDSFSYGLITNYRVGVYGPRHICTMVSNQGYSASSFVCDMSSGFSGNIGYPLPKDWAFDQIHTVTIGSGTGAIEIDNDISAANVPAISFQPTGSLPSAPTSEDIKTKISATVLSILKNLGMDTSKISYFYGESTILMDSAFIKLEEDVHLNVSKNSGSKISGNLNFKVSGGKLGDATVSSKMLGEFNNNISSLGINIGTTFDFDSIATTIGDGKISITIKLDGTNIQLIVASVIYNDNNQFLNLIGDIVLTTTLTIKSYSDYSNQTSVLFEQLEALTAKSALATIDNLIQLGKNINAIAQAVLDGLDSDEGKLLSIVIGFIVAYALCMFFLAHN